MPLYDYKCTACSNRYELRESFDAPPRQPCPVCGAEAKRVLHPPPIVFKGSGFYITDSRKGSQATLSEANNPDTSIYAPKKEDGASAAESKPDTTASAPAAASSDD